MKKFRLKDAEGNVTNHLAEAIEWARGKTVLNLDRKDVPFLMTAAVIRKHRADAFVMLTVHSPEQARYYYEDNKDWMFSAFVKTPQELATYEKASIPAPSMIDYVDPIVRPENQQLYRLLNAKGIVCMISAASSYDKLAGADQRATAYRAIIKDGADILESDRPIEAAEAIGVAAPRQAGSLDSRGPK